MTIKKEFIRSNSSVQIKKQYHLEVTDKEAEELRNAIQLLRKLEKFIKVETIH